MVQSHPPRTIHSFVRRQGRMTQAQAEALKTLWPQYGITLTHHHQLDFDQIFGRVASTTLEIGFGMGDALIAMAQASPEINFVGIDVHRPGIGACLRAMHHAQLKNIRLIEGDAVDICSHDVPDDSLDRILIFFPDPWPKTRHHKRRLIQPVFIDLLAQKIKLHGQLHLATDWQPYAKQMLALLSNHPDWRNTSINGSFIDPPPRPMTKFERRGKNLGHGTWDLVFERC